MVFKEFKLLEEKDLELLNDVVEDDDMIFDMNNIKKFYNDKSTISFIAKTNNKIVGFAYGYDIIHPDGKHAYFLYSIGMLPDY